MGDCFVICQDSYWLLSLPQEMGQFEKSPTKRPKFFRVDGLLELCMTKDFRSNCHRRLGSPLRLEFLVWVTVNRERINSASEACIGPPDKSFPGRGCIRAISEASLGALFSESNTSLSFDVKLISLSVVNSL